jgi:DNA-directed RNA polymerase I, II, and III subunit RPABC1
MTNTLENSEIGLLFKVRKTVLTTLKNRGYLVPEGSTQLSFDDFKMLYEKTKHHLYFPEMEVMNIKDENKKGGGVLVYFESSDKFDKRILQSRMIQLGKEYQDLDKLFFVLKTYGSVKKQTLNGFVKSELLLHPHVEILQSIYPFDFMKNIVVPECFLLSEDEKNAVLNILDTPLYKLPKFEITDPIPERLDAKIGDVIYIKRNGGKDISYRVVVKPGTG